MPTRLTPEFQLETRDPQRFEALRTMVERYGFELRSSGSSHYPVRHKDERCSDITFGLVHNSQDITYQRVAAKACLEAEKRLNREACKKDVAEKATVTEQADTQDISAPVELPEYLQVTQQKNQIIVRLRNMPEIGMLYPLEEHEDLAKTAQMAGELLRERAEELTELLRDAQSGYHIETSRDPDTNRLSIHHPFFWRGCYHIAVWQPSQASDIFQTLDALTSAIGHCDTAFHECLNSYRECEHVSNVQSEQSEDGVTRESFDITDPISGLRNSVSFSQGAHGNICGDNFIALMDEYVDTFLPQHLRDVLGHRFGIAALPQKDGSVLLRQKFFDIQRTIPNIFQRKTIRAHAETRFEEYLKEGQLLFTGVYSEAGQYANELLETWSTIHEMSQEVLERLENEAPDQAHSQAVKMLTDMGFSGQTAKNAKWGRFCDMSFKHPATGTAVTYKAQILQGSDGDAIFLAAPADLEKMKSAAEKVKQAKSPTARDFSGVAVLMSPSPSLAQPAIPQDPIAAAIERITDLSR